MPLPAHAPVRAAAIGVGGIAVRHLTHLLRLPEAELVALVDLDLDRARSGLLRAAAAQIPPLALPDIPLFTDTTAMLRAVAPAAVFIALPPSAHGAVEHACIAAGVPMMVQKPVALDMDTAREIQHAAEARGLITSVGYQARYSSAVDAGLAALADRTIGMAIGAYMGGLPRAHWWRVQAKSGGQVVEQATHVVDLMRYAVGEIASVQATARTRLLTDVPDLDIADVSVAMLEFECGAIGTLLNTSALDNVPGEDWNHGVTLIARDLSVRLWLSAARIAEAGAVRTVQAVEDPMLSLDAAFLAAVARNDPSGIRSSYADGAATLQVTLALEASVRTGQPVRPADV
jgi:predicted dehydrogenase